MKLKSISYLIFTFNSFQDATVCLLKENRALTLCVLFQEILLYITLNPTRIFPPKCSLYPRKNQTVVVIFPSQSLDFPHFLSTNHFLNMLNILSYHIEYFFLRMLSILSPKKITSNLQIPP